MKDRQVWLEKGIIFKNLNLNWSKTHAMLPTPLKLNSDIYRIFFGTRNKKNQSSIGFIDYNLRTFKVINKSTSPILEKGGLGTFDDNGVLPSSLIKYKKKIYLFYIGWKPGSTTRYSLIAGLSFSKDLKSKFKKYQESPILYCNKNEPYSILTAPSVYKENKFFYMWYVSCNKWINKDLPTYDIKFAKSKNLVDWIQTGKVCIKLKKNERAVARPFVIKERKIFKMWYSYEKFNSGYQIGYAESKNGINWKRLDHKIRFKGNVLLNNQMRAYSVIIQHKKNKYMFYNGNDYGKFGIHLAKLETPKK
ncbi:hypothetical protein OAT05_00710 [Candidatus Pelagibacter sp.]|nr:hypothetical protein [Candidatus Pelagibacter sp.]